MRTRKIFARVPPEEFAEEFARRLEAEYARAQREHQDRDRTQD